MNEQASWEGFLASFSQCSHVTFQNYMTFHISVLVLGC